MIPEVKFRYWDNSSYSFLTISKNEIKKAMLKTYKFN